MNRRTWSTEFSVAKLGLRGWVLTAHAEAVEIFLIDASSEWEPGLLIGRVAIDWAGDHVDVELATPDQVLSITARSAWVHEPRADIYRRLPLEIFSVGAQRFWKRIFALVRIPGGRALINFLARRSRA